MDSTGNLEAVDQDRRSAGATASEAVRPFRVNFSDAELAELRRRISVTRWPEQETVTDESQGVPLATLQGLARYWGTDYDWRKVEARLNALPQFITEIDGLDIHFIHVRSKHENALPLIVTHGWPGSIIEQLKIVDPLTNPTAHGASASDAFHLVIPSLPGYGFSGQADHDRLGSRAHRARLGRADEASWIHAIRVARRRLGRGVCTEMAKQAPPELLGIHANLPGNDSARGCEGAAGRRPAAIRSFRRRTTRVRASSRSYIAKRRAYAQMMGTRPQTLYGIGGFARRPGGLDV